MLHSQMIIHVKKHLQAYYPLQVFSTHRGHMWIVRGLHNYLGIFDGLSTPNGTCYIHTSVRSMLFVGWPGPQPSKMLFLESSNVQPYAPLVQIFEPHLRGMNSIIETNQTTTIIDLPHKEHPRLTFPPSPLFLTPSFSIYLH